MPVVVEHTVIIFYTIILTIHFKGMTKSNGMGSIWKKALLLFVGSNSEKYYSLSLLDDWCF